MARAEPALAVSSCPAALLEDGAVVTHVRATPPVHRSVVAIARAEIGPRQRVCWPTTPPSPPIACDLFSGYKSAADTITGATVAADVFHLVRLGLQALDDVRRRRQQQTHGHRGRGDEPLFKLRRVLRVAQERLSNVAWQRRFDRLRAADPEDEVAAAWHAVDLLRRMYAAPDRDTAHGQLVGFYEWVVEVEVPELTRLATTIDTWQEQVLALSTPEPRTRLRGRQREDQGRPPRRPRVPQRHQLRRPHPASRRPTT